MNDKRLMPDGESKEWTKVSILKALADEIGAGKCINQIYIVSLDCDSNAIEHMWTAFMKKVSKKGLEALTMTLMKSVKGSDVISNLVKSPVSSLTYLDLSKNASWWQSNETFDQLIIFVER